MTINQNSHFLYASTIHVMNGEGIIQTVLGSCIAVCIWDKVRKTGGMNHYMLPLWDGKGLSSPKFGNVAVPKLIDKLLATGSMKENLVAKVFGGADLLQFEHGNFRIGKRNIEVAWEILNQAGIPIVSHHVGGRSGRKIYFNVREGSVHMKLLGNSDSQAA
jgi:chemotaxis protein CheD